MIKRFIHRLLLRRHFWRYATFSEVAEIYVSRTIRLFALRMVAVFTSIYLLQEGFGLFSLALFWAAFFFYKAVVAWPAALLIAKIGPKHSTFVSNILAATGMVFLSFVGDYGWWALGGWLVLHAASSCLYDLSYLVNFSKIKSVKHAGKEIAFMNIFEKVASSISPIVGGFLAFLAGPSSVMVVAAVLFMVAALPLFFSDEPTRTGQKLSFRGFPWRLARRSLFAETAVGFDVFTAGTAWTLFMAVVIFAGDGNEIYAKVGLISSVTLVAALAASYAYGKVIDRRKGGELLRFGTIANAFTHTMRAFVATPTGVVFANIMSEGAVTAYSMAFIRGVFDTADLSGRRIAYLYLIEVALNLGATIASLVLAVLIWFVPGDDLSLRTFFIFAAFTTLFIATSRFNLYRK